MEHGEVVEDLDITLLQGDFHGVLLGQEVDRVQGLGLEFSHGGDVGVVGGEVGACEGAAGELEARPVAGEVVEEGAAVVLTVPESGVRGTN